MQPLPYDVLVPMGIFAQDLCSQQDVNMAALYLYSTVQYVLYRDYAIDEKVSFDVFFLPFSNEKCVSVVI